MTRNLSRIRRLLLRLDRDVRSLTAQGSTLLAGQVVASAFFFAATLVLARGLGSEDYGRYALIITTSTIIFQLIDVRVWEAATRFASEHLARGHRMDARAVLELAMAVNLLAGLVATGILVALAEPVADRLLREPDLSDAVVIYAGVAPFTALQVAAAVVFRVFDRFGELAVLFTVSPGLRLGAVVFALAGGGGLRAVVAALLLAEASAAAAFVGVAYRRLAQTLPATCRLASRLSGIRHDLAEMGRFLAISSLQGSLRLVNTQLDVVIVGYLGTPSDAGTLKLARSFVMPLSVVQDPFYQAIYPRLSRARALGELADAQLLIRRMTRLAGTVLVPVAGALCLVSPWLIPALVGDEYAGVYEVVIPLALGTALWGTLFWVHPAALATDLQTRSLGVLALASGLQVLLIVVLFSALGVVSAGIAYAVFVAVWAVLLTPAVTHRMAELSGPGTSGESRRHRVPISASDEGVRRSQGGRG
jgi:O-antigen/teichoic acid export membrane protein